MARYRRRVLSLFILSFAVTAWGCPSDSPDPGSKACSADSDCQSGEGCINAQCVALVDECAAGTDTCDADATCSDTRESFTCACNDGFTGDGATCTDIDECASGGVGETNCLVPSGGSCANSPGGYTCAACPPGHIVTDDNLGCAEAVDITGQLPYATSIDTTQGLRYVATGFAADTIYTIAVRRTQGLAILIVPDAVSSAEIECGVHDPASLSTIECAMLADSGGQLAFRVRADSDSNTAHFEISISEGGIVNEGTAAQPVEHDTLPVSGGALSMSYYKINGLTASGDYTFSFANATGEAGINVFEDEGFDGLVGCSLIIGSTSSGDSCIVRATVAGTLYVRVRARSDPNMMSYELSLVEYTGPAYVSEGTSGAPVNITGLLPYAGEVGADGNSYYRVEGLTPGAVYTISLQRTADAATLIVPLPSGGSTACGWDDTAPDRLIECAMVADGSGVIEFSAGRVIGTPGGQFVLDVVVGGVVNEGSSNSPVEITSFPWSGGAMLQSFYHAGGLSPYGAYTFTVSNLTGDIAFFLYDSSDFGSSMCTLNAVLDPTGFCVVSANASGSLYIGSSIQNDNYGVTYTMDLVAGGTPNQGTLTNPIDITNALATGGSFDGTVSLQTSYYRIDGLTAAQAYTVTVTNISDNIDLRVLGEGTHLPMGRREDDCWTVLSGVSSGECVGRADSGGSLWIDIGGSISTAGASFTIAVAAGGLPNEGYYGAPVDVTGQLPRASTIYNGPSRYVVTGLTAGVSYTTSLSALTALVNLGVYEDGTYATRLCGSSNSGTADEACAATAPASGELHIWVAASTVLTGGTFTLDVQ